MKIEELNKLGEKIRERVEELILPATGVGYILIFHSDDEGKGSTDFHTNFNPNNLEEVLLTATLEYIGARKGKATNFTMKIEPR